MKTISDTFNDALDITKYLTETSQADFDTLARVADQASGWVDEMVQVFYDTLFAHPHTAAVFRPGERPAREETLRNWYLSLFHVQDAPTFWKTQLRISFAHVRRHIKNEFMVGIANKMRGMFMDKAIKAFGEAQGLQVTQAFSRILDAVVALTTGGYDVVSKMAFSEATGADLALVDTLIQSSLDQVQKQLFE